MCITSHCDLDVTFDLGCARMYAAAIFETQFSHHKGIWITATDYYMYFYLILQSPLIVIL